jgi:hypothetical protein
LFGYRFSIGSSYLNFCPLQFLISYIGAGGFLQQLDYMDGLGASQQLDYMDGWVGDDYMDGWVGDEFDQLLLVQSEVRNCSGFPVFVH